MLGYFIPVRKVVSRLFNDMTKVHSIRLLLLGLTAVPLFAQSVPISSVPGLSAALPPASACTGKTSLLCAIPNLYGPYGLVLPNPGVSDQFLSFFQTNFAATATQLTLLPLASPASGFVYHYDPKTGLSSRTSESFGPVLTERGETIGRHRFYFGGTFQRFRFNKLDGVSLHDLPAVLPAAPGSAPAGAPQVGAQFLSTQNSVDIKINQFTFVATYGVTNRIDVSVAVPVMQVGLNVSSVVTINRIAGTEPILSPGAPGQPPVVSCCSNGGPGPYGPVFANYFDPKNPQGSTVRQFSNNQSSPDILTNPAKTGDLYWNPSKNNAAGLGDITLRVKDNVYRNERLSFALLADIRLPSGDANNFLGSGALGIKPVAAVSVRTGPLTPHVNLGYQWNGSSVLGGNPYLGTSGRLPGFAIFSVGTDVGITKWLTASVDYLGQELINAPRVATTTYTSPGPLAATGQIGTFPTIAPGGNHSYNQSDSAFGAKINLVDRLLLTGNVIVALNQGGLRQRLTPLIALSYTF